MNGLIELFQALKRWCPVDVSQTWISEKGLLAGSSLNSCLFNAKHFTIVCNTEMLMEALLATQHRAQYRCQNAMTIQWSLQPFCNTYVGIWALCPAFNITSAPDSNPTGLQNLC